MTKQLEPDFAALRKDFPMLQQQMHGHPLIYLDSAATAQKPEVVINTITDFYRSHYGTVHRALYELSAHATEQYEAVREKIRYYLNASQSSEIVFTRGTTDGINLVAHSFGKAFLFPGDEILVSSLEHHSNLVPWQILCKERGVELKIIPMNERGELSLTAYKQLLNDRTKLVAVSHIANSIGTINPIEEMIALAHEAGAKVLIDGAQSAPHMAIDVQKLDADFFVFSGHKFYGPTGIGILYGKQELLEAMPPYQGGGDMVHTVTFDKATYNPPPLRFEAGTPMIAEVMGLGAAVDYISSVGISNIQKQEKELAAYALQQIREIPLLSLIGDPAQRAGIISFVVKNVHPLDIGMMLDLRGIAIRTGSLCAQPVLQAFGFSSICRASVAFYNTKDEIDHFCTALREVITLLLKAS